MNNLIKSIANPSFMWLFGIMGDALLIVGLFAAIKKVTIAGFTPVSWFLLAISCYLGMIWIVTLCILARVENRKESQVD